MLNVSELGTQTSAAWVRIRRKENKRRKLFSESFEEDENRIRRGNYTPPSSDQKFSADYIEDAYTLIVAERLKDCRWLVDELSRLNAIDALFASRLDLERLGAMGYSFGGITVAEFARIDSRCKAIVLLDAGFTLVLSTNLTQHGLQKPFLAMSSGLRIGRVALAGQNGCHLP